MSLFTTLITQAIKKVQENNHKNPNVKTADTSVFDKLKDKLDQAKAKAGDRNEGRGGLFDQLRNRIDETRKENEADPNVETADASVFDDMQKELEALKAKIAEQEMEQQNKEHAERIADLKAQAASEKRQQEEAERKRQEEANRPKGLDALKIPTITPPVLPQRPKGLDELSINRPTPPQPQVPRGLDDLNLPKVNPSFPKTPTPPPPSPAPAPSYHERKTHAVAAGASAVMNGMGGSLAIRMHPELNSPQSTKRIQDQSLVRLLRYTEDTINVDGMDSRWVEVEYEGERGWVLERYLKFS